MQVCSRAVCLLHRNRKPAQEGAHWRSRKADTRLIKRMLIMHPRHPGRHIGIDSQPLILSFELKFFCADMFPYEDSKTVSVCLSVHLSVPREKKLPWLRQYQSYISNWYINGNVFTSTTPWKPKNKIKIQKSLKFEFWLVTKSWNHLSFVNISPTLVIDASMERSSRVLQHWNPKIWKKQKSSKFEFWFVTKSWNHLSFVNISRTLASDTSMERSSRVLQHWNPKIWKKSKKSKFEFWLVTKSWNHLSFVNISRTLASDRSMERSSRVLQHWNPKIWRKKSKKFEIRILTCDEELKSP